MRMQKDNLFFFLAPQPITGYYDTLYKSEDKQLEFLSFISAKDVYDTFIVMNKRGPSYFTPHYLTDIGMTEERAIEIVAGLLKFGFIYENSVIINDQTEKIYVYRNSPALIILFTALDLIVNPQNYWNGCIDGPKQYFKTDKA